MWSARRKSAQAWVAEGQAAQGKATQGRAAEEQAARGKATQARAADGQATRGEAAQAGAGRGKGEGAAAHRLGAGLCAALALASPAAAQLLAPGGGEVRLDAGAEGRGSGFSAPALDDIGLFDTPLMRGGELGLLPAGGTAAGPERGWGISPSLGLTLAGTDNVRNTARDRRGDAYLTLTPAVTAFASTARFSGSLAYNPSGRFHAEDTRSDRFDQRFFGTGQAVLVEDLLFLDLLGSGSVSDVEGNASGSTAALDRNRAVQTTMLQAAPYLLHRFGGDATLQLGYAVRNLVQDGRSAALPGSSTPFFKPEETTMQEVQGALRSGENFGPLGLQLSGSGTTYSGTSALAGAHRIQGGVEARYAVTRWLAPVVALGYEDQSFGGTRPFTVQGMTWSVGARLTAGQDSSILLRYGRRDGYESASLNANVALGARTRLTARYSDQIGTALLQSADLLSAARTDALGNLVDGHSGGRLVAPFGTGLLATQSAITRNRRGTLGLSQSWTRDTLGFFFTYDERLPLSAARGTTAFAQTAYAVSLSWSRQLDPATTGSAFATIGRTERDGARTSDSYGLRLRLNHSLTASLSGWVEYGFGYRSADLAGGSTVQNLIILGLRQFF
ncbi:TIGR03016 family PEP-CTERM system-associated outer membrane protein [Siccirubricoccus phaeus]|uniref:TIGR03016 family PEP-CTERM system-associated outer membrane protein n=1 Tax=Siccirubricoccus phaeus TaxID=2595053 RepID=UPI0011F128EB|nr:TIGR03016 family PEP-CTERM system-associated outer membrane protein [Siccirubricoccus phaeus]